MDYKLGFGQIDTYRLAGGGFGVTVTSKEQMEYRRAGFASDHVFISDPDTERFDTEDSAFNRGLGEYLQYESRFIPDVPVEDSIEDGGV